MANAIIIDAEFEEVSEETLPGGYTHDEPNTAPPPPPPMPGSHAKPPPAAKAAAPRQVTDFAGELDDGVYHDMLQRTQARADQARHLTGGARMVEDVKNIGATIKEFLWR